MKRSWHGSSAKITACLLHFSRFLTFSLRQDNKNNDHCILFQQINWCFGEYDGFVLVELPDDVTASAAAFLALTPGHVKDVKTTKLFTVEETM